MMPRLAWSVAVIGKSPENHRCDEVYLRPDVKLEPLVCRWSAWPHLLAPGTAAMNLAFRYLPNLRSFVSNPGVHVAAAKDPSLLGGPFVDLKATDIPAVRDLIHATQERCAGLLSFARDLRELSTKLDSSARGFSLQQFLDDLPDSLAGLLELVYDTSNHPGIKLIEELLYAPEWVSGRAQELCVHDLSDSARPFFLSTPHLDSPERLILSLPLSDSRVDELAAARLQPVRFTQLAQRVLDSDAQVERFQRFFTPEPPTRRAPDYQGKGVRVRMLGHACALLQTPKVSILIDPSAAWVRDDGLAKLTFADLPDRIDYLLLSHSHQDHVIPEMLIQLRQRVRQVVVPANHAGNLADPSLKLLLRHLRFDNVVCVDPFDSIELPDGEIVSLPFTGEHAELDIYSKQCLFVRLAGQSLLFLVDSDGADPATYRRTAARTGKVDVLFVGMECQGAPLSWLYGPLLTRSVLKRDDDSRRLSASNSERAWSAVESFQCSRVYVYAMGQEPWLRHWMGLAYTADSIQLLESERFIERCRRAGIEAERLSGAREFVFGA